MELDVHFSCFIRKEVKAVIRGVLWEIDHWCLFLHYYEFIQALTHVQVLWWPLAFDDHWKWELLWDAQSIDFHCWDCGKAHFFIVWANRSRMLDGCFRSSTNQCLLSMKQLLTTKGNVLPWIFQSTWHFLNSIVCSLPKFSF